MNNEINYFSQKRDGLLEELVEMLRGCWAEIVLEFQCWFFKKGGVAMNSFLAVQSLDVGGTIGTFCYLHRHNDGTEHHCETSIINRTVKCSDCRAESAIKDCQKFWPKLTS
ncbi:MAG: hypothetical protein ABH830_04180 [Patescibacteria group bacterium]